MFSFANRSLIRRAPLGLAATLVMHTAPFPTLCQPKDAVQPVASFRTGAMQPVASFRTGGGGSQYPVSIGKKFIKLYFAEMVGNAGKIDMHQTMNFDEVKHMLTACGAKSKDVNKMFDEMDTDGSGDIDYVEIVCFFVTKGAGTTEEKAALFFDACDIDCSGSIEPAELKDVFLHMMTVKKESQGEEAFIGSQKMLYADIPEEVVLHLKANELVAEVFAKTQSKKGELTDKEFQKWLVRGGKQVDRLNAMFTR